jgi:hypothetical protein
MESMNTKLVFAAAASAMTLAFGQDYPGSDIRTATPIEFGQVVADNIDETLRVRVVYSVSLARGQRLSVTTKERGSAQVWVGIYSPSLTTIANGPNALANGGYRNDVSTFEYAVPAAGTYYIAVWGRYGASEIETVVNAVGARLDVPLPAVASCLEGNVDEIQFNLQQVSMNLAEQVTVGGVKICAACDVKPTLFPAFVDFLRQAHFAGTRVQVCHAADGQIVRVKSAR